MVYAVVKALSFLFLGIWEGEKLRRWKRELFLFLRYASIQLQNMNKSAASGILK